MRKQRNQRDWRCGSRCWADHPRGEPVLAVLIAASHSSSIFSVFYVASCSILPPFSGSAWLTARLTRFGPRRLGDDALVSVHRFVCLPSCVPSISHPPPSAL